MLDARSIDIVAHELSTVIHPDDLRRRCAREVDSGERSAVERESTRSAGQIVVYACDQARTVDAGRYARARAWDRQYLVGLSCANIESGGTGLPAITEAMA